MSFGSRSTPIASEMGPIQARSHLLAVDPTAHIAVIVTDPRLPDNPIVDCNEPFLRLTGYSRQEVIGRNCRFLTGPETDSAKSQILRESIANATPAVVELISYRKDGSEFLNSVMIAPVFDETGKLVAFLGSQIEVPAEAREQRVRLAKAAIASLTDRQKQILSKLAAGHRTKQIAHELGLCERTVKMHRATMLRGLGATSSAQAIRLAVEAGL